MKIANKIFFSLTIITLIYTLFFVVHEYMVSGVFDKISSAVPLSEENIVLQKQLSSIDSLESKIDSYAVIRSEDLETEIMEYSEKSSKEIDNLTEDKKTKDEFSKIFSELNQNIDLYVESNKYSEDKFHINNEIVELYGSIDKLRNAEKLLLDRRTENLRKNIESQENVVAEIEKIFIFTSILVFLFGVFFSFLSARNIVKPIIRLRNAAIQAGKGKIGRKDFVQFEDEFYEVAEAFNQMNDRLAVNIKNMEKEIAARTEESKAKTADLQKKVKDLSETRDAVMNIIEDAYQLEEDLKKEHDRIEAIINSVIDSILVLDASLIVLRSNISAEKMLGKEKNDLVGKYLGDIIDMYKDNKNFSYGNCFIFNAIFTGQRVTTKIGDNYTFIDKNGKKVPIVMAVSSLQGAGRDRGVVLMIRDITSEKKLDDAKTGFISTASHQLRTPLTSLRWFSEMLMEGDAGRINKNQKTFLGNIYEGITRMINLVNLLLQLARVEAGRVKIEPVAVNLPKMMEAVVVAFKIDLEKKKQKVTIEEISGKIPDIFMDYEVIWQVLQNLISNAIRYSPEKGIINVKIEKKDKFAELSVQDSGIGIPKDQQEKIFEKFYRANNAMKAVPEGSGLGLALVRLLVEGWGGSVRFESEEGKGTTFFITIPLSGMEAKEGEVKLAV